MPHRPISRCRHADVLQHTTVESVALANNGIEKFDHDSFFAFAGNSSVADDQLLPRRRKYRYRGLPHGPRASFSRAVAQPVSGGDTAAITVVSFFGAGIARVRKDSSRPS